jgi:PAS domain S-box-containing protein
VPVRETAPLVKVDLECSILAPYVKSREGKSMTLRRRLLSIIGVSALLLGALAIGIARSIVLAGFEDLEFRFARRDAGRAVAALDAAMRTFAETVEDYGSWNDTIDWLEGRAPDFEADNLTDYTFEHLDLQAMLYFDVQGQPFWTGAYDPATKRRVPLPVGLAPFVEGESRLLRDPTPRHGLLELPEGPMIVGIRPVLNSDGHGSPHGTVVFGRFLDAEELARLSELTHSQLALLPDDPAVGEEPVLRALDDRIEVDTALPDLRGRPGPILRQVSPRPIYQHGQASVVWLAGPLLLLVLLWGGAVAWFLDRKVLRRIGRLRGEVERIRDGREPSRRVAEDGSDELGSLARQINSMLVRLDEARAETRWLAQVVEESGEGMLLLGEDGLVRYANAAAQRLVGQARANLVGAPAAKALPGVDATPLVHAAFRKDGWRGQLHLRRHDGASIELRATIVRLQETLGDRLAVLVLQDVTREHQIEAQLHQAQKMDAVGRLAGGIAHDFNNLLTVILSCTRFLEEELAPDAPHRAEVREIGEAATRAAKLTRQLLTFSRKTGGDVGPVALNETVLGMERMLRRLLGEHIELATAIEPALWTVRADAGQLEQVIVNLAVNARDAMPDGGRLTLATANVHADPVERPDLAPGDWVSLSVSDTGRGMPPDVLAHLFEPFFTTKAVGKGTGLGLSTVYGIVRGNGGQIRVQSAPGEGSTFTVLLPRVEGEAAPVRVVAAADGGRERILLVEDEPGVRRLAKRILERRGYTVVEAAGVEEALRHLDRDAFDLVLSDVVMPGGGGRAVLDRVRRLPSPPPILLMSGHTGELLERLGGESPPLLEKPFTPETLARQVREVLDAACARSA